MSAIFLSASPDSEEWDCRATDVLVVDVRLDPVLPTQQGIAFVPVYIWISVDRTCVWCSSTGPVQ